MSFQQSVRSATQRACTPIQLLFPFSCILMRPLPSWWKRTVVFSKASCQLLPG